jgi:hypothetical protein
MGVVGADGRARSIAEGWSAHVAAVRGAMSRAGWRAPSARDAWRARDVALHGARDGAREGVD